ncbi:MAG: DDE-type integrase/transposase/recombinase [Candidatus Thermoplasmatota archaeon]|nr:DDE-type integrase/transposase/recombinase [Candidatus Thermoplasmatota archaeon]
MDKKTRFLIANAVTIHRSDLSAKVVLKKAKELAGGNPKDIVTDGLASYPKAIRDVFEGQVTHIGNVGIRDTINNNTLERYHGTWRERDKVMRGLDSDATAEQMLENYRTYYNFIRRHTALGGKTPAEMAYIDLNLGQNKWLSLIQQATEGKQ